MPAPVVDHPVHFLRSGPFQVESGLILFYDVVESSALSRSSVLSCIAEAEGEAQLPTSVTVSDFRKWLAATTDVETEFQVKSFTFMCTVIKVADAVDDSHIGDFVCFAAKKLIQNALLPSPRSAAIECDNLKGIHLLTHQLQRRVFAAALDHCSDHMDVLLNFLPPHLHGTVLLSSTTPEGMLQIDISSHGRGRVVEALASLCAYPPSVLSFKVSFDMRSRYSIAMYGREEEQSMVSQLARALRHHAGLTSLHMLSGNESIDNGDRCQILASVAQLTSLRFLNLDQLCRFSVQNLPALKQVISSLPQLHSLALQLLRDSAAYGLKRQRDAQQVAPPQVCLAELLSPATALTSLSIRAQRTFYLPDYDIPHASFVVSNHMRLPNLCNVTAIFHGHVSQAVNEDVALTAAFFHRLEAPLTSIRIAQAHTDPPGLRPEAAAEAQRLLDSLAAFTQLRCFSAALPTDAYARRHSSVFNVVTAALPPLWSAFRQLQECSLTVEPAMGHQLLPQLAAAAPAITQLHLTFRRQMAPDIFMISCVRSFTASWRGQFESLSQLQLRHLLLDFEEHRPKTHGLADLHPLTQLTALLVPSWSCLRSPADWQALACMTCLQHLCLDQTADLVLPPDSIASLRALTRLTSFTIKSFDENQELVPALAAHLPSRVLPALQELTLALFDPFDSARELTDYAATLPALRKLTVHLFPAHDSHEADSDWDPSDEESEMCGRHRQRVEDVDESLQAAATARLQVLVERCKVDQHF